MKILPAPPISEAYLIDTYPGLVEACIARRRALGMSQCEMDARAGWAEGLASKIEMSRKEFTAKNARAIGKDTLPTLLETLGLSLVLVPTRAMKAKPAPMPMADRARTANRARNASLLPERRQEIAREAARRRWASRSTASA